MQKSVWHFNSESDTGINKELDFVKPADLPQTFKFDFDATSGQTDFICSGKVFTECEVFQNGLKLRDTTYSLFDNGTDTTVVLSSGATSGDWLQIKPVEAGVGASLDGSSYVEISFTKFEDKNWTLC